MACHGPALPYAASFGERATGFTVTVTTGADVGGPAELIRRVDEKLYQAKHEGRNRVVA